MSKQPKAIHITNLDLSPLRSSDRWSVLWQNLSIQQKLPFLIFILLVTVIGTFSWVSYLSIRKAAMNAGKDRVTALADKLTIMFKGSMDRFTASAKEVSGNKNVHLFLVLQGSKTRANALTTFQDFLRKDTTNKAVQLLDAKKNEVLRAGDPKLRVSSAMVVNGVGRIVNLNGNLYFPVIAPINASGKNIGYLVNWKHLYATPESIEQFGQLLGSNGRLYFGNDNGLFWTDLIKPVPGPPVGLPDLHNVVEYDRNDSGARMGSVRNVPGSRWVMLVELSGSSFLETSHVFLRWVIIVGLALIAAGSFGGWLLSRSITRPLSVLDNAAAAIANGDYAMKVPVHTKDELGRLAVSFNTMSQRVHTTRQGLEQQVAETSKELETAITDIQEQKEIEKKKDEFVSLASHELKTPLTTIKAFFQLVVKDVPSESGSFPLIIAASRQVTRMEHLISDLLDVSRINAGQLEYILEKFDFGTFLKETINMMQEIYSSRRIVLEQSIPIMIIADRHRIGQVIINLINNAVKYSPNGGPVLVHSKIDDDKLSVTVEDFGIGIERKNIGELFQRFRLREPDYRFQGLGLGLYISAEIIKRHHGNISVQSELGKGSAFTFELPLNSGA